MERERWFAEQVVSDVTARAGGTESGGDTASSEAPDAAMSISIVRAVWKARQTDGVEASETEGLRGGRRLESAQPCLGDIPVRTPYHLQSGSVRGSPLRIHIDGSFCDGTRVDRVGRGWTDLFPSTTALGSCCRRWMGGLRRKCTEAQWWRFQPLPPWPSICGSPLQHRVLVCPPQHRIA